MKICWMTINVKNLEESLKFYQDVVGLNISRRFKAGPDMEIAFVSDGNIEIELIYNEKMKDVNIGQDISIGIEVDSVKDKMHYLKNINVDIHSGPFEPNENIVYFFVLDPNGLKIQFIENKH